MSVLSVDNISPIGSGTSVTINNAATLVLNNLSIAGVVTATSFAGSGASLTNLPSAQLTGALPAIDGSNLTGISAGTSLSGSTNNTVCTVTGANAITGEANLTFDGSTLTVKGASNTTQAVFSGTGGSGSRGLEIVTESVGAADEGVILNARASGTTGRIKLQTNDKTAITILGDGGDVGIGTESPQSAGLTVVNHAETRLQVWANGDGSNGKIALRADGTNTQMGTWSNHDIHLVRNTSIQATVSSTGISFPSGKGIDFSATSDASGMSSELLDDYEEGSWTPTILGWDTFTHYSGSSYYAGWYVKVGDMVHCGWKIYYQNLSTPSSNAHIRISGLPYAAKTISAGPVTHVRFDIPDFSFSGYPVSYLSGNNTQIHFYKQVSGSNNITAINATGNYSNNWTMGTATYATN